MRFFVLIPAGSKYIPLSALPQLGFCQGSARLYFAKPNTSTKTSSNISSRHDKATLRAEKDGS